MKSARRFPWLLLLGAGLVAATVLALFVGIPQRDVIAFDVIGSLVFASAALWQHASAHATGQEWWQDDSASGWRGY
jgi:uncharacterized membrane protein YjjP (DUF1212 family)